MILAPNSLPARLGLLAAALLALAACQREAAPPPQETLDPQALPGVLRWLDKVLSR